MLYLLHVSKIFVANKTSIIFHQLGHIYVYSIILLCKNSFHSVLVSTYKAERVFASFCYSLKRSKLLTHCTFFVSNSQFLPIHGRFYRYRISTFYKSVVYYGRVIITNRMIYCRILIFTQVIFMRLRLKG